MRRIFGLSVLVFLSCGGGDDLTPVEACKQEWSILCDKFFNCLTADEKEAAKPIIGLNAADCKAKFQASECNADKAKCDAGETFHSEAAETCLSGIGTLSCNDVKQEQIVLPASCDQVCTK
jgi:hypothetical protein